MITRSALATVTRWSGGIERPPKSRLSSTSSTVPTIAPENRPSSSVTGATSGRIHPPAMSASTGSPSVNTWFAETDGNHGHSRAETSGGAGSAEQTTRPSASTATTLSRKGKTASASRTCSAHVPGSSQPGSRRSAVAIMSSSA